MGYFVGGVASLESGEIAGIAVTLSAIAIVLLVLLLVFFVRQRNSCSTLILRRKPTQNVMEKANGHIHQTLKVHFIGLTRIGIVPQLIRFVFLELSKTSKSPIL